MVYRSASVQIGADVGLVDLVVGGAVTAVADQDGAGDFLVQHHAHFSLQPGDNVKVGDIDDVIAVKLLLLVDRGGGGAALQQAEHFLDLEVALGVALRAGVGFCQVGEHGFDAGERGVMDAAHDVGYPALLPGDKVGRGIHVLCVGEQEIDVGDAVGNGAVLHGAIALGIGDDRLHVGGG